MNVKAKLQDSSRLAFVTQTTLSVDDTKEIKDFLIDRFQISRAQRR